MQTLRADPSGAHSNRRGSKDSLEIPRSARRVELALTSLDRLEASIFAMKNVSQEFPGFLQRKDTVGSSFEKGEAEHGLELFHILTDRGLGLFRPRSPRAWSSRSAAPHGKPAAVGVSDDFAGELVGGGDLLEGAQGSHCKSPFSIPEPAPSGLDGDHLGGGTDDASLATAATRRTAQERLSCLARNGGARGPHALAAWGGSRQGKKVETRLCGLGGRGFNRPSARSAH